MTRDLNLALEGLELKRLSDKLEAITATIRYSAAIFHRGRGVAAAIAARNLGA